MGIPIHPAHLPQPLMPQCPPQHRLQGQKALVTGAGSGIGRAIALALARGTPRSVQNSAIRAKPSSVSGSAQNCAGPPTRMVVCFESGS